MAGKDKKEESKAVAVTSAAAVPAFMKQDAGKGTEKLDQSDYEMPRIKLMQGLSDELQAYDMKAGDFFHTLMEEGLGTSMIIVPLFISKRMVLWRPRVDGGGILARADDCIHWNPPSGEFTVKINKEGKTVKWRLAKTVAESRLDQWSTFDPTDPNSQPAATLAYLIVVALPERPDMGPVALILQRTAVGPARKLLGKLKISQAPCYGMKFNMQSFDDDRGGQKFKNYRFTAAGFVEDEAEYAAYKQFNKQFETTGVAVKDLEGAQEDGVPAENREAREKEAASSEKNY